MKDVFEIELRAFLTPEKYFELVEILPTKMELLNKESLHSRKFKSSEDKDIRLRFSERRCEVVHKNGSATDVTRREITINFPSKKELDKFAQILEAEGFEEVPPWITHRMDFKHNYSGYEYDISLQNTENFAHILEVEFSSENKNDEINHEKNIREILHDLGCEPISKEELSNKIQKYCDEN